VGLTGDGNVAQGENFPMFIGNLTWGLTVESFLRELGVLKEHERLGMWPGVMGMCLLREVCTRKHGETKHECMKHREYGVGLHNDPK
jgi:hypothetical protein